MLQYWMLLQGLDIYDAWEDPENSVWGVGSPENSILVFHRGQCGPGLLFKAFGPKGSTSSLEVVNNSISKETYNIL